MTPRSVAVLGSTGSIGRQTLDVVSRLRDRLSLTALVAHRDGEALLAQARVWRPAFAGLSDPDAAREWAPAFATAGIPLASGPDALVQAVTETTVDTVVLAVAGAAGLPAALTAASAGKRLALATKESLVAAGHLVMAAAARSGARVLPIDSEHSAVWQCLEGGRTEGVERITLTASGGPFLDWSRDAMRDATPEQALRHPVWRMGAKITIDSATLMNKGLEVIEALWLFGLPASAVDVVIHRQGIVHSLVTYRDGSTLAQLSPPDMRLPIQYALLERERAPAPLPRLDLSAVSKLTFEAVDRERFPCLDLAYAAAGTGGTLPAVMNAANEIAVAAFLAHRCRFTDIPVIVEQVMLKHTPVAAPDLADILSADLWARRAAEEAAGAVQAA